jgi:hypothetical protein
MVTATDEMEITDETPLMALLRICRNSPSLSHHPDLMPALVSRNFEKILEHLQHQRAWFSNLSADMRDRMEYRKSRAIRHAREACAALSNYEMRLRAC